MRTLDNRLNMLEKKLRNPNPEKKVYIINFTNDNEPPAGCEYVTVVRPVDPNGANA